ncbi:MAG: amidohydrolase [Desulfamplus sp.]|nr:amidohydrolase [Desulfamplus sp.]
MKKATQTKGYLGVKAPLPGLDDSEGEKTPGVFSHLIDAHVHIFPEVFFRAVWGWFDKYGWPIRYQLTTTELLKFLFSRGIDHVVAFQYAHKPGMASYLNDYMVEKIRQFEGKLTGMATVFPGEQGAVSIIEQAFQNGLKGVKLHAHVQCFDLLSVDMEQIYNICSKSGHPMVIHAGREPGSPAYSCDPYELCGAQKVEEIIRSYPALKLCVPHLGMDEFDEYKSMIERYDNLWLDTAMAITDYLPFESLPDLDLMRSDRIMYGSDFPNIPFAWDRELKTLANSNLSDDKLKKISWENAANFFAIDIYLNKFNNINKKEINNEGSCI